MEGTQMSARTEVYKDAAGEWRWRRVAGNGEVIADSGESYTRKYDALMAAEDVFLDDEGPMPGPVP
jgi:uncharacterized protein YegP (UPF0339 family)